MARYTGSVCRFCRREGEKLFLKGERCVADKCAFERRAYAPGEHGQHRIKETDYGLQLREKQKTRRAYGILERQFKNYFKKASRKKGVTGLMLLQLLESRLDSLIYRLGFAISRNQARQLICHGHVLVNQKRVDIPSYLTKVNDVIEVRAKSQQIPGVIYAMEISKGRGVPAWIELDAKNFKGIVRGIPSREDIQLPINEQLIVELYSK
ncbi:MAG: 30S ribosomal protein S4 [Candidatus Schekmanbacteria bacterium RBG_13_48_7]|uniref:Small ribosomal subunit protein uS4 n=1 Tax=Candidatus Schekmanbacteria bacterium RBG_13_48_7 TaxID=1817878 RepID=A0A1F7RRG2_9BACT|nr:MAG: 30S ribosomal protein S4 [Candidatus Schekmanbacteria bacterium RBG_13_48_7]